LLNPRQGIDEFTRRCYYPYRDKMIQDKSPLGEPPITEDVPSQIASQNKLETGSSSEMVEKSSLFEFWERLSQAGLAESALRLGTHTLLLALILLVAWAMQQFYAWDRCETPQKGPGWVAPPTTELPTSAAFLVVHRDLANPVATTLPRKHRVSKYTVER
jgi:hypothetical protein